MKHPYDTTDNFSNLQGKYWSERTFNLTLFYSIIHAPSVSFWIYQPQHTVVKVAP